MTYFIDRNMRAFADFLAAMDSVKEGDKTVNYYMDMTNPVAKANHAKGGFCQSDKKVKVTGEVSEKDGKKFIAPTKIEVVAD